jgi:glycosyltransferase involved in cell wall biosynthesis
MQLLRLLERAVRTRKPQAPTGLPAIVFHGYVHEPTGYGSAARAYIHALHAAGVPMSIENLGGKKHVTDPLIESLLNRPIAPDFHLCHTVPAQLPDLDLPSDQLIALTAWETDRIPESWARDLACAREVWVPCGHNAEVFARSIEAPVFQLPHPYLPHARQQADASDIDRRFGLSKDDFLFFNVFEWQERKCPLGTIQAFLEAFPDTSDAVLILKCWFRNADERRAACALTEAMIDVGRIRSGRRPRVMIETEIWPEHLVRALFERGNCFVSLHRGEGWGNPPFEAACNGLPVIATGYSGPADYLDDEFHYLVKYSLTPVTQKYEFFSPEMLWAEPDISHAATLMRRVYCGRAEAEERARTAAPLLRRKFSIDAVGRMAADRLRALNKGEHDSVFGVKQKVV